MLDSFGRSSYSPPLSTAPGESQLQTRIPDQRLHLTISPVSSSVRTDLHSAVRVALRRIFSLPYCQTYVQIFLSQGLACGLAPGVAFLPALSCISHWFKRRRGAALGVFATGASIGGLVYPILLNKLLYNPKVGFPWAIRAGEYRLRV